MDETTGHVTDVSGKFSNVPDVFNPILAMRLGFNTKDLKGYSEADLEGGPTRFGMGLSGLIDFDLDDSDNGNYRTQLDYILKANGFSTTGAVYLMSAQEGADFSDQSYGGLGFHAQLGYVIKGKVQPVFRYAYVNPEGAENQTQELLGGISVYVFKHNLKWQTDGGAIINQEGDDSLTDGIVRTQLQLAF